MENSVGAGNKGYDGDKVYWSHPFGNERKH